MSISPSIRALALLGLAIGSCAAPAASAEGRLARAASEQRPVRSKVIRPDRVSVLSAVWRFHTGSTVHAAPALGPDGTVYVGTGDGLLEAVTADGALAWSYTLEGSVAQSPVLDAEGHVIIATMAERLYAFSRSGGLSWQVRTPTRVVTGLSVSPAWGILFGGLDGALWAYSSHATPAFHVPIGTAIRGAPAPSGHRIWVGTQEGLVLLDGAVKRGKIGLDAPVESLCAALADGSAVVISGETLSVIAPDGTVRFRRPDVAWATTDARGVIAVEPHGRLLRLGADGTVLESWAMPVRPSAPPAVGASGRIYVSGQSGNVAITVATGKVDVIRVASSALHRPVVDPLHHRVIIAAGEGTITALPDAGR